MRFDPEQLRIGTEIEKEHTDDPAEARRIAQDHLRENPRYYPTGKRPKGKKEALRYIESILCEADRLLPRPETGDTLVIHMDDRSTDFLKVIYGGKGYPVIKGKITEEALMAEIEKYPRIFMLGHGGPSGLFGPGYLIGSQFGEILRGKTGLYVWCHAVEYAHRYKLTGLVSGMFISEVAEARYVGIEATQKEVTDSNYAFSKAVRRYLETGSSPHEVIKCYSSAACAVTKYNNERLYVMEQGVILDALGKPQPEEVSAKPGSPRYRHPGQELRGAYGGLDEPPDEFKHHYGWQEPEELEPPASEEIQAYLRRLSPRARNRFVEYYGLDPELWEAEVPSTKPVYTGFDAEYLNSSQPIPQRTATVYATLYQPWAVKYARAMRDKYGISVWVDGSVTMGWKIKVHAADADRAQRMFYSVVGSR